MFKLVIRVLERLPSTVWVARKTYTSALGPSDGKEEINFGQRRIEKLRGSSIIFPQAYFTCCFPRLKRQIPTTCVLPTHDKLLERLHRVTYHELLKIIAKNAAQSVPQSRSLNVCCISCNIPSAASLSRNVHEITGIQSPAPR